MTTDTTPTPTVAVEATTTTQAKDLSKDSPSQYRMAALDLDGTLLNSQHRLSEATIACLRDLDQRGFTVIIATGRAISTVYETVASLNLPHPIPVVCSNGAEGLLCSVKDNGQGGYDIEKEFLFSTPVPQAVAQRSIALSTELGLVTQYYIGEEIYANPQEPHHFELTKLYKSLTGSKTIYVNDSFQGALEKGLPSKQLVLCKPEEQDDMIEAFEQELAKEPYLINGKRATIVRGHLGWFLELLHGEVCKGNGLMKMCQHLNISPSECVAFGDGDNDIEFLQVAGKGFAMKNARDVVKEIADEVLEYSNDEDGVARTLKSLAKEGVLVFES